MRTGSTRGDEWLIKGLDEKPQLKVCFNVLGGSCRPVPEAEEEGDRRQTCQKEVANPFSSSGPAYTHTSFLLFWWRSENKKENARLPQIHTAGTMFTDTCSVFGAGLCLTNSMKINMGGEGRGRGVLSKMAEVFKWFMIW